MTVISPFLNINPNWKVTRGYTHGMPQPSMFTVETFPSGSEAEETTRSFVSVIRQMVENNITAVEPQIDGALRSSSATASAIAAATVCLQLSVCLPVASSFRVNPMTGRGQEGRVGLILPWWRIAATKTCYAFCTEVWNRLAEGEDITDISPLVTNLNERLLPYVSKSVNEFSLIKSVTELGINLIRMPSGFLCLGTGKRSRWMNSTTTDFTSGMSLKVASDKLVTARILRHAGLPGAENSIVNNADQAVAMANQLGGPVVIKPMDLERGEGISADLRCESEIRTAYKAARAVSKNILIEKMIPGFTHRLTVASGNVISVRQRVPGGVTGDGTSTIAELVSGVQKSERGRRWQLTRGRPQLAIDAEAFELMTRDGLAEDTILPDKHFLRLRRRDNINAGGENRDIEMTEVHPDNLELAVSASRALRLDIAGIDLITADITRSWRDVSAGICEVNGKPQFASYRTPEIFQEIIKGVVGPNPHVSAHLVLCSDTPSERAKVVATVKQHIPGQTVSTVEGLWQEGSLLTLQFPNGYDAAIAAATRADTEAMTCVMSMRELLSSGSPLRSWERISIRQAGLSDEERALVPAVLAILAARLTNTQ